MDLCNYNIDYRAETKGAMAKALVTNLNQEIERLQRESETIARKKSREGKESQTVLRELKYEVLGPMNEMNFDDLQRAKEQHEKVLNELEENYCKEKQRMVPVKDLELDDNVKYNDIVKLRVFFNGTIERT